MADDRLERYERAYREEYGFEAVQVAMRQRLLVERIRADRPSTVIEIGCGAEPLYETVAAAGFRVPRWIIVEPAAGFARDAAALSSRFSEIEVVELPVQEAVAAVRAALPGGAELVICAGLLHEVPDASVVLAAAAALLADGGTAHFSVPNAGSLHRRLGVACGAIADVSDLSERNRSHLQQRVYDRVGLRSAVEAAGLETLREGGYFVKPFTHAQMEQIRPILSPAIIDGLYRLGQELPELASEIFVDARRRR